MELTVHTIFLLTIFILSILLLVLNLISFVVIVAHINVHHPDTTHTCRYQKGGTVLVTEGREE